MGNKAICWRCKRDVTGQTHIADPMGGVTCRVCDHSSSKPKLFNTFEELLDDAFKTNASGVVLRKCLNVERDSLLNVVNNLLNEEWRDKLIRLVAEMGGGS